jgi:hypothetical protein
MPTLTTRASKGSELSHSELDANFKRTVTQKTTTYACLVSDNRSIIEGNHATTAFTITLGDATTMLAADTGDYEVTITNVGAAVVTVARAGADTIDGAAASLTLAQYSSVTLGIDSGGDYKTIARVGDIGAVDTLALGVTGNIAVSGTVDGRDVAADGIALDALVAKNVILNTSVIELGDWQMNTTSAISVPHGVTQSKIRTIQVGIVRDTGTAATYVHGFEMIAEVITTDVFFTRLTSGKYDSTDYDRTSFNRGWMTIGYVD